MASRKTRPPGLVEPVDDYRAARVFRLLARRLAVPNAASEVEVRRCGEALDRARREAARAADWSDAVDAMCEAAASVFGERFVARVRADVAAEPAAPDPDPAGGVCSCRRAGVRAVKRAQRRRAAKCVRVIAA